MATGAVPASGGGPSGPAGPAGATGPEGGTAALTTDGDILSRAGGVPVRITRTALAADPAFSSTYMQRSSDGSVLDIRKMSYSAHQALTPKVATTFYIVGSPRKYAVLDGTNDFVSTPDVAAQRVTTQQLTITALCSLTDWTPTSEQTIVGKADGGGTRAYRLRVTSNQIELIISTDGNNEVSSWASTPGAFGDGSAYWIRATRSPATGVAVISWAPYDENVPTVWTALATISGAAGNPFAGTALLRVGSFWTVTQFLAGKVYRAIVTSDTTDVADMQADDWATGTTFTSSTTGELWTLTNGAAVAGP